MCCSWFSNRGEASAGFAPETIVLTSLQPVIPWQVALLHCLPPLHQLDSMYHPPVESVNHHLARAGEFPAGTLGNFQPVLTHITEFIDEYYNRVRLHSKLGYCSPEEFEQTARPSAVGTAAKMSFFRHREIYRSDVPFQNKGEPAKTDSPDHRFDESPPGYSSAGWSPQEPASASPDVDHSDEKQTA